MLSVASDLPDLFGKNIKMWIGSALCGFIFLYLQLPWSFFFSLIGMPGDFAKSMTNFVDLFPPLVVEGGTLLKEMPKAPAPYWA